MTATLLRAVILVKLRVLSVTYLYLLGPVLLCYLMMLFELGYVRFQDGEKYAPRKGGGIGG